MCGCEWWGVSAAAGKDIEKACQGVFPLQNTYIRKVKVLRSPKFDVTKLMEVGGLAGQQYPTSLQMLKKGSAGIVARVTLQVGAAVGQVAGNDVLVVWEPHLIGIWTCKVLSSAALQESEFCSL